MQRKQFVPCESREQAAILSWLMGSAIAECDTPDMGDRLIQGYCFLVMDFPPYYNGGSEYATEFYMARDVR